MPYLCGLEGDIYISRLKNLDFFMQKSNAHMCIVFEIWGNSGCVLIWQMCGGGHNKILVFKYQNILTKNKVDDTLSIQG